MAATIKGNVLYVANIGDSRLYLLREQLEQVTRDHSYVEELVALGKMKRGSHDYIEKKISSPVQWEQGGRWISTCLH